VSIKLCCIVNWLSSLQPYVCFQLYAAGLPSMSLHEADSSAWVLQGKVTVKKQLKVTTNKYGVHQMNTN
jgi:hypothetical protein